MCHRLGMAMSAAYRCAVRRVAQSVQLVRARMHGVQKTSESRKQPRSRPWTRR